MENMTKLTGLHLSRDSQLSSDNIILQLSNYTIKINFLISQKLSITLDFFMIQVYRIL